MAGYSRQSSFGDTDIIEAADHNNEYNQIVSAFDETSGHAHDGTADEGPVIGLIGDVGSTPLNKVLVDTVNDNIGIWIDVSGVSTEQVIVQDGAVLPVTDNDIDLGSATKEFKDIYVDGVAYLDAISFNGVSVTGVIDDDSMATASATTLPSSESVKAYVDNTVSGIGSLSKTGTPVDNQIAVWTSASVLEGDPDLTFDSASNTLTIGTSGSFVVGASTIISDSAGSTTLSNIDILDNTTETTIENAIDTLPNLTAATSLASVGTITSGTWQGTAIATGYVATTLTGKTLTTATLTQPTLTLKQSTSPTPTAEGDVWWDTDDNKLVIGDGSGQKTFVSTSAVSGDITMDTSGSVAIGTGVIVNADISNSAAINATKIGGGGVDNTEFGYLDGVTSSIQTQINTANTAINTKQATLSGASLTAVTVATTDKVLVQDTSDADNLKTVTAQSIANLAVPTWVFIKAASAASDSQIDFLHGTNGVVLDSTYDEYVIRFLGVKLSSAATDLYMRTSTDASTFDTGSTYDYSFANMGSSYSGTASASQTQFIVIQDFDTGEGASGTITIVRPSEATNTSFYGSGGYEKNGAGTLMRSWIFTGAKLVAEDVNGIRFTPSSGTISSGLFALYGIKRA